MPQFVLPPLPGRRRTDVWSRLGRARRDIEKDISKIELPSVEIPKVEMPKVDLAQIERRLDPRRSSGSRLQPAAPILGAIVVGLIVGIWLATWPVTATRLQSLAESMRTRFGMNGNRSRDWATTAGLDEGGVATVDRARVRPAATGRGSSKPRDLDEARVEAGVAVGPGRTIGSTGESPFGTSDTGEHRAEAPDPFRSDSGESRESGSAD